MHPVVVAAVFVVILAVGVYIGVSGLTTQYGLDTSGSDAAGVACAPDTAAAGRTVTFGFSGLAGGTPYHWAADEGKSEVTADGKFRVIFGTAGAKEVSLFWLDGSRWQRTACVASVR